MQYTTHYMLPMMRMQGPRKPRAHQTALRGPGCGPSGPSSESLHPPTLVRVRARRVRAHIRVRIRVLYPGRIQARPGRAWPDISESGFCGLSRLLWPVTFAAACGLLRLLLPITFAAACHVAACAYKVAANGVLQRVEAC